MAESRGRRQAIPVEFRRTCFVCIHLLACSGKALDGEFFQSFAEPVEARTRSIIFEWKHQKDALRRRNKHGAKTSGLLFSGNIPAKSQTNSNAHCEERLHCKRLGHQENCNRARIAAYADRSVAVRLWQRGIRSLGCKKFLRFRELQHRGKGRISFHVIHGCESFFFGLAQINQAAFKVACFGK